MTRFSAVLDACVLYSAPLRDSLMRLAVRDVFKAYWTDVIHEEWMNALERNNQIPKDKLIAVRNLMDANISDAKVEGFECLINSLDLPDPKDRHVLAAAIKCKADSIVTFNLEHFPQDYLSNFEIELIHPDDFLYYQLDMNPKLCIEAFHEQRAALIKPPMSVNEFINTLDKQKLPKTASFLMKYSRYI